MKHTTLSHADIAFHAQSEAASAFHARLRDLHLQAARAFDVLAQDHHRPPGPAEVAKALATLADLAQALGGDDAQGLLEMGRRMRVTAAHHAVLTVRTAPQRAEWERARGEV